MLNTRGSIAVTRSNVFLELLPSLPVQREGALGVQYWFV